MGIASIVLGVVSMICAIAGVILSWVPFLGALLSFGSPVLALIGIVLGGVAMSRAKEDGVETGVPMAGLIVSIVAFFPALLVALTCGVCNSMCSAATLREPHPNSNTHTPWYLDGGNVAVSPGITPPPVAPVAPPANPFVGVPDPNVAVPNQVPIVVPPPTPGAPPPAFPPPPP